MERLKRNPGGWGLVLGGAIGLVSIFFSWVSVTNTTAHVTEKFPMFRAVTGQTMGFLALLAMIAGLGVMASSGGGRFLWGLLGLLGAGTVLAVSLVAIFSPSTLAAWIATTQSISTLSLSKTQESVNATMTAAFDDGTLTASVAFGAFIGLVGGLLGVAGAILGFRKKAEAE
jgi:hypothetical protein